MATLLELARGQNIPGTKISTLLSPMGVEPVSTKVDSFTPWRAKRKAAITAASQNALSPVNPTEFEDVSDYTESKTGMKADAKRKALLPTVKDGEWTAPGIVHEAAKALSTTEAFFEGVPTTMEDMTNLAGSFGSSSYGLSSFDPKIAGSTLGMFVGPKARNRGKDYNDVKNLSDLLDANVDPLWESLQRPQTNKKLYEQTGWFKGADKKLRTEISDHAAKFNVAEDEVKHLTSQSLVTDRSVRDHMLLVRDLHERVGYGESIDQAKASLAAEIADYDRKLATRGISSGRTPDQIEKAVNNAAIDILHGKTFEEADQALTYYTRYGSSALTGGFTAPLSTVLKHDELFDEYPVLNHVQVRVASNLPPNINGELTVNPHTGLPEIILNGGNKFNDDQLSTLLHEVQHSIQTIEGFDEGTNAQHFMDKYGISRDKAFDRYLQQHGEAEARMTEARQLLTPKERKSLPPYNPNIFEMSTGVKLKDIAIGDAPPKGRKASESAPKIYRGRQKGQADEGKATWWSESEDVAKDFAQYSKGQGTKFTPFGAQAWTSNTAGYKTKPGGADAGEVVSGRLGPGSKVIDTGKRAHAYPKASEIAKDLGIPFKELAKALGAPNLRPDQEWLLKDVLSNKAVQDYLRKKGITHVKVIERSKTGDDAASYLQLK